MRQLVSIRLAVVALFLFGCSEGSPRAPEGATRGYVLISVDTLRADHLGAYGYERETSPFFDRLASDGVLFERAIVQLPGTLPSHMSIFTGLYPAEHAVYPPAGVLSDAVPTLPELFRAAGYRTGGFTEGGYVDGAYGFARGFEAFADPAGEGPRSAEKTFDRGLEFLDGLAGDEPFFLFLHTYAAHDPYDPPAEYRNLFWEGDAPAGSFEPNGPNLVDVNRSRRPVPDGETREYFVALYDAGIRYVDDALESFWEALDERGLTGDVTLVITSDHGEEFLEHGKLVHEQIYRETVHVPLLVVTPGVEPARVGTLVESVDVAPTLLDLAGIDAPSMSGRSLDHLLHDPRREHRQRAYSEAFGEPTRGLFQRDGSALWHAVVTERPSSEGFWVEREISFDVIEPEAALRLLAYHEPREVTIRIDGMDVETVTVRPDDWTSWDAELGPGIHRVTASTATCTSPSEIGESEDPRCLGFRVAGVDLRRVEIYDAERDPAEAENLSHVEMQRLLDLAAELRGLTWTSRASPDDRELPDELRDQLESLGYLQ